MTLIELKNVTFSYEKKSHSDSFAVNDVSFSVKDDEFWGIIGHTGSGKSTLTELMAGLKKASGGKVLVGGKDLGQMKNTVKELKGKVGMVFQYPEHQLFEESVIKDVAFGPKNLGLDEEECINRAKDAMRLVGLDEKYEILSPFELSGGEKRRVAIAGILAMKPDVLILDEPTAGLDPKGRDNLLDTLIKIKGSWCKSIVLVSHSMEDVARCADKVLVMNKGKAIMQGGVREIFSRADILEEAGLDVPQITRLTDRLRNEGFDFEENILTVDEAVEAIYKKVKGIK